MAKEVNINSKADLKQIFDAYYGTLVQFANRFLEIKDECEDIVQDVFVTIWENQNTFPDTISLKVYLYKAVRNKCYNVIKHKSIKQKYAENLVQLIDDDDLFLKQILEEEIVRQLHKAIESLPERKKEIIKLSLKGLKNIEIAEELSIKLQTVKTLKSQSYTILRDLLPGLNNILYFLLI